MERRGRPRSKSAARKKSQPQSKSPRGRPRKAVAEAAPPPRPRSRGRPLKPKAQRSRSRSPRARATSRSRSRPKKKSDMSDDDQPLLILNDVVRSGSYDMRKRNNLPLRRSLSREVESALFAREPITDNIRRSARMLDKKGEQWRSGRDDKQTAEQWRSGREDKKGDAGRVETAAPLEILKQPRAHKVEFGGSPGVVVYIVGWALVLVAVLLGCTKEQCLLKAFHVHRNWRVYLNVQAALAVVSFFVLQTLLAALPIGRVVKMAAGTASYRANGFLAALLTGGIVAGAWYLNYPITLVYERWLPAATAAYVVAWLLSLALFIKGGRAPIPGLNPYGNTGHFLYDFFMGREVNPVVLGVNLKIVLLRVSVIGSILLDCLLALKSLEVRKELSPTLFTLVALKVFYSLDSLWFEESFTWTFEAQYEGLGLMTAQGLLLHPFFSGLLVRFLLMHPNERSVYALAASACLYLVGYCIYRASNLQKAALRRNPLDPTIAHLETISTSRGKKLLVSGWWGQVKHPNYLGDTILAWAIASCIGGTHFLPYIVPLAKTLFLMHRAQRDNHRCYERYQAAWAEYTQRVPYKIIPRIY